MLPCIAFADDMASIVRGVRDLLRRLAEFRVLESCSGIKLNLFKTELMPVGTVEPACWKVLLEDSLPALHEVAMLPVVKACRYLGFRLERGSMHFDWHSLQYLSISRGWRVIHWQQVRFRMN
eukprot:5358139-Amphidinium_carterae.1